MYLVKIKQGRNQGFGYTVQNLRFGVGGVLEAALNPTETLNPKPYTPKPSTLPKP